MSITVFLADDHAIVRDGLRAFLSAEPDIQVVGEAGNGRDALRQIEKLHPDVAILDIAMPELNGIETARRISLTCPSTRVIILSMHSTTEHIFRALQAGACGFLMKESAGSEVIQAMHAVHSGHRYLSEKISDKVIDDYVRQREAAGVESALARLTTREREVLQLIAEGNTTAEIADLLGLCDATVSTYRSRVKRKLGVDDTAAMVRIAIRKGLTPLE